MNQSQRRGPRTSLNADERRAPGAGEAKGLLLGAGLLLLLCVAVMALGTPASAGSCVLDPAQRYEVDDSYLASNPAACQYKTIQEVMLLPLVPGDLPGDRPPSVSVSLGIWARSAPWC